MATETGRAHGSETAEQISTSLDRYMADCETKAENSSFSYDSGMGSGGGRIDLEVAAATIEYLNTFVRSSYLKVLRAIWAILGTVMNSSRFGVSDCGLSVEFVPAIAFCHETFVSVLDGKA